MDCFPNHGRQTPKFEIQTIGLQHFDFQSFERQLTFSLSLELDQAVGSSLHCLRFCLVKIFSLAADHGVHTLCESEASLRFQVRVSGK